MLFVTSALAMTTAGWVTLAPASAAANPSMCEGQVATMVATADDQTITGTDGPDVISSAGYTNVTVMAGEGDDLVCTDGRLFASDSSVHGGPGDDTLVANSSQPIDPYVPSGAVLYGDDGDDVLDVEAGEASILPGPGDDVVHVPMRPTLLNGRPEVGFLVGQDIPSVHVDVRAGTVDGEGHDTFTGVMTFYGTEGGDVFEGGPGSDYFYDGSGIESEHPPTDIVRGRGGDDAVTVFHGDVDGGQGNDSVYAWRSVVHGGAGNDDIFLREGGQVDAGPGADVIDTNIDNEYEPKIGVGKFVLAGGAGPDTIFLTSPEGDSDSYQKCYATQCRFLADGGPGADVLSFQHVGGRVHLDLASGKATFFGAHATVHRIEKVEGSSHADVLLGTQHADHLDGNQGPDRLIGRAGPDILHGGPGHDTAFGGPGHDRCVAEIRHSC